METHAPSCFGVDVTKMNGGGKKGMSCELYLVVKLLTAPHVRLIPDKPGLERPPYLACISFRQAAERDYQVHPVLQDGVFQNRPATEVLTSEQCVRSHCAG